MKNSGQVAVFVAFLLATIAAHSAQGLVSAYNIEPVKAAWSGWSRGGFVSQLVTCNFDSLSYVELFAGDSGASNEYIAAVFEDSIPVTQSTGTQSQDCEWVKFENWDSHPAFTRGKQYEFKFTRSGSDSIEFYYDHSDPYKYGNIPDNAAPNPADLCMRVYGAMDPITRQDFGAFCFLPIWDDSNPQECRLKGDTWVMLAQEAGIGWGAFEARWHLLQPTKDGPCQFNTFDDYVWRLTRHPNILHAKPAVVLMTSPTWASSRDTLVRRPSGQGGWTWYRDTAVACAPRNLWDPDSNYWSMFLSTMLGHTDQDSLREAWQPCDSIHTWIIGNECNDTCVIDTMYYHNVTGWWRRPNRQYTGAEFAGLRGLVRLYLRMGYLAAESIRDHNLHGTDRVLIGNMHRTVYGDTLYLVRGVDWLRACYEVAEEEYDGPFWDGVAFHPYQEEHLGFDPAQFEDNVDSIRAVMRAFGDEGGEVWNTEMGWNDIPNGLTEEQDCRNVAEALTAAAGSRTRPEGGYDRTCWWMFYRQRPDWWCWALLDSNLARQDPFYAYKQTREQLVGKRCNGRVMLGDARDDSCRIYEFESPADGRRTWVAWMNDDGTGQPTIDARIPARSDGLTTALLAYSAAPTAAAKSASASGWLPVRLGARPVFITESTAVNRTDLIADSVRFETAPRVGEPVTLRAWVRNTGRQTPDVRLACMFYGNGDSLGVATRTEPIGNNATAVFTLSLGRVPESLRGDALFSATVNPRQSVVEANGLDDNTAYLKAIVQ